MVSIVPQEYLFSVDRIPDHIYQYSSDSWFQQNPHRIVVEWITLIIFPVTQESDAGSGLSDSGKLNDLPKSHN